MSTPPVADAVPTLCGADHAAVALWDAASGSVWMAGLGGWPPDLAERAAGVTSTADSPELSERITVGAPVPVDLGVGRRGAARRRRHCEGGVPITVDDRLVGIVLAHWSHSAPPSALGDGTTERMWGLAAPRLPDAECAERAGGPGLLHCAALLRRPRRGPAACPGHVPLRDHGTDPSRTPGPTGADACTRSAGAGNGWTSDHPAAPAAGPRRARAPAAGGLGRPEVPGDSPGPGGQGGS